jgi:glucokinase
VTIAVDIGGTSVRVARWETDDPSDVMSVAVFPTPPDISQLVPLLSDVVATIDAPTSIGIGCAGLVDSVAGIARWMPHAAGRDAALGPILQQRFGVPVVVDNDANLASLAEARRGAGVGMRTVLTVTIGTGIGAGWCVDGEIERGRGGLGEVGHMRVAAGPRCECGEVGCWESLVSGRVIDRLARDVLGPSATAADLVLAAATSDSPARAAFDDLGTWLGVGLGNLIVILDPDIVVVGGGAMRADAVLLGPANRYLEQRGGGIGIAGPPGVVPAMFGPAAGLVGAALAAREVET